MRKHPFLFLYIIGFLTVISLIIAISNNVPINVHFKIPLIARDMSLQKTLTSTPFKPLGISKDFSFKKGLDLSGGTSITLKADMKNVPAASRGDALDGAKEVIDRRINLFGVSEPLIQTSHVGEDYRVIVELPGVDVNQAVSLIGSTAQLTFWEEGASTSAHIATPSGMPIGIEQLYTNPQKTNLSGKDLQNVNVGFDQKTGEPNVELTFGPEGAKKFADISGRNVGRRVAIALDTQLINAPVIREIIPNGQAQISGGFTIDQAKQMSIQLKGGSLPVPLSVLEEHQIGATLGSEYLSKILFAGIIGFVIIVTFMLILYGRLGVLASIALVLYTIFVIAIFKTIPVTLTLAGIAGFILSIGMAVDANILIFERMKEELRLGRSESAAIELGFSRAWSSIRDSNISTLITSFILYQFGTGIVRGFAVTLAIGVLISMFSAIAVTRSLIRAFYHVGKRKK